MSFAAKVYKIIFQNTHQHVNMCVLYDRYQTPWAIIGSDLEKLTLKVVSDGLFLMCKGLFYDTEMVFLLVKHQMNFQSCWSHMQMYGEKNGLFSPQLEMSDLLLSWISRAYSDAVAR